MATLYLSLTNNDLPQFYCSHTRKPVRVYFRALVGQNVESEKTKTNGTQIQTTGNRNLPEDREITEIYEKERYRFLRK